MWVPALPLRCVCCVTWGELLYLSGLSFLFCKMQRVEAVTAGPCVTAPGPACSGPRPRARSCEMPSVGSACRGSNQDLVRLPQTPCWEADKVPSRARDGGWVSRPELGDEEGLAAGIGSAATMTWFLSTTFRRARSRASKPLCLVSGLGQMSAQLG